MDRTKLLEAQAGAIATEENAPVSDISDQGQLAATTSQSNQPSRPSSTGFVSTTISTTTPGRNPSFLNPLSPSIRVAYSTNLQFWTVWRVLGAMFIGIAGGTLLTILSLVSVLLEDWSRVAVGITNLSLMTSLCVVLMLSFAFSFVRLRKVPRNERSTEQYLVLIICATCGIQPYLNPIALGFRWAQSFPLATETTLVEAARGYVVHNPRISGFASTFLVSLLYGFCFFEMQRFREERVFGRRRFVLLYFIIRMCFTQAAAVDFGSVPIAAIFTLIKYGEPVSAVAARAAGVVIVSTLDVIAWMAVATLHRETGSRLHRRVNDEDQRARTIQYALSVFTIALWSTQICVAGLTILCTPADLLESENLGFTGAATNTVGCCCAFLLVCWTFALGFANFPLGIKESSTATAASAAQPQQQGTVSSSSTRRKEESIRVRYFNFETEVPSWAVLVVGGRHCFVPPRSSFQGAPRGLDRQSSITSQDAQLKAESQTLSNRAKTLLSNSLTAVGEALTLPGGEGGLGVIEPGEDARTGTIVNFVLEHACTCLNFANVVYNSGNFAKPQTNAQVQLLVEDKEFQVYRQVSCATQDVHAIVFFSRDVILVSFRGTQSKKNLQTDATFNWKTHYASFDWEYDSKSIWARKTSPKIHAGFRRAYAAIRLPLLACVEELLETNPRRSCRLCGHSMGGSLACLFAFDVRKKLIADPSRITVFTYGSSRLGNESFRVRYNHAVPQTFSLFCAGDPVSKLPPRLPFGLPLGYKHHGIAVMLLSNGAVIVRPKRAEVAVLYTYAPGDWSVHRVRSYAQCLMRWCVFQGIDSTFRPFWNNVVAQVHHLPFDYLSSATLLRYLIGQSRAMTLKSELDQAASVRVARDMLHKELTDALNYINNNTSARSNSKSRTNRPSLYVSIQAVRFPSAPSQANASRSSGFPTFSKSPRAMGKKQVGSFEAAPQDGSQEPSLTMMQKQSASHEGDEEGERNDGDRDGADEAKRNVVTTGGSVSSSHPSDWVFVSVSCGSVAASTLSAHPLLGRASKSAGSIDDDDLEDQAVDEPEQSTMEARRGMGTWVRGLDPPSSDAGMAFGGRAQLLRPEFDRLTFKLFRRASECQCENGLLNKLLMIPSTASNVIANASSAWMASTASATNTAGQPNPHPTSGDFGNNFCSTCSMPVCLATCEVPLESFFDELASEDFPRELIFSAVPSSSSLFPKENFLIRVALWKDVPPVAVSSPIKSPLSVTSTMSPLTKYVANSPINLPAGQFENSPSSSPSRLLRVISNSFLEGSDSLDHLALMPSPRTAGENPLYDSSGLFSSAAYQLSRGEGFLLRVKIIRCVGVPHSAARSPMQSAMAMCQHGLYCKLSIPATGEKHITGVQRGTRVPVMATASTHQQGEQNQHEPTSRSMLNLPSALLENVNSLTSRIIAPAQKVLQVDFQDSDASSFTFGDQKSQQQPYAQQTSSPAAMAASVTKLNGFEELVIKVRKSRGRTRMRFGEAEINGVVIIELQKIIKAILSSSSSQRGKPSTPVTFARWFQLRGPNACGKLLVAFDIVLPRSTTPAWSSPLPSPSTTSFLDSADEDQGTFSPTSPAGMRLLPPIPTMHAAQSMHFALDVVVSGLRYLPVEYAKVALVVQVRDEYNPRQALKARTQWLQHSGVVAGWSFPAERFLFGSDAANSLEGSEELVFRLVDGVDATIAKRELRVRELLADFAEERPRGNGELVSIISWVVLPYRTALGSSLVPKRSPEIKLALRISQVQQPLNSALILV